MSQSPDGIGDDRRGNASPATETFETQILALIPSLRRFSRSLSRSDADGEDLLQDCVEKALVHRHSWRGGHLRAWACTIMTNLYRNRQRDRMRHPAESLEGHEDIRMPDAIPDTLENDRLHSALDGLPPDARAVLMLVTVEGYTYAEVAEILQIPAGTVMSRLSRARDALRARLTAENVVPIRRPR